MDTLEKQHLELEKILTFSKINKIEEVYEIEEFLLIRDEVCTGRIETTYDAVLEFIDWFNLNQK